MSTLLLRLANIAVTAVVAHIMVPRDFGIFTIALTAYTVVSSLSEFGIASCLIRADLDIDAMAPTMVTLSWTISSVFSVLMAASASNIAAALGSADGAGPIMVMALVVLISGVTAVPGAQLTRDFKQDKLFLANVLSLVPSTAALLLLAKSGSGALAFAWSRVIAQFVMGCVMMASAPRYYKPGLDRAALSVLYKFGLPLASANFVNFVLINVDYAFVGHLIGAVALGAYMLAFNLASSPGLLLGNVINSIAMPAFSRVRHDPDLLKNGMASALRAVSLVLMPACGLMIVLARPLILTVYGAKWVASAEVLSILSLYGAISIICVLFANMLTSLGKAKITLVIQLIWLGALVPAMAIGVHRNGIVGAAMAHIVIIGPVVLPSYLVVLRMATGVRLTRLARAVLPSLLAASAAALAARVTASLLARPLEQLASGLAAGGLVYLVMAAPQLAAWLSKEQAAKVRTMTRLGQPTFGYADFGHVDFDSAVSPSTAGRSYTQEFSGPGRAGVENRAAVGHGWPPYPRVHESMIASVALRPHPGVPLPASTAARDRLARQKVGLTWGLLILNALTFYGSAIHIPSAAGKAITQGALPLALLVALTLNRKLVIRPNVFLSLVTLLVMEALITSLQPQHLGTVYRTFRLAEFVVVLWLLSPWWGRRDLLLVRAHLVSFAVVLGSVILGLFVAPGHALSGHRLSGVLWDVPSTEVGHYTAVTTGIVVVLWLGGRLRGKTTAIVAAIAVAMLLLSHTRTALVGLVAGLLVSGLSLILTTARVRRFFAAAGIVITIGVVLAAGVATTWLARGQSTQELTSLTGRTDFWGLVLHLPRTKFQEIFGFGLSNGSVNGLPVDSNWLVAYLQQGLFGVVVCAIILLLLLVTAFFQPPGIERAIALFLITYSMIASFTQVGFTDATTYLLELTLAASLLISTASGRRQELFLWELFQCSRNYGSALPPHLLRGARRFRCGP